MIEYRNAVLSDIEQLNQLYQDFFNHNASQQPLYYKPAIETGKYPKHIIESDNEALFVATNSNNIIAFMHLTEEKTPPFDCYVPQKYSVGVDLYVLPDFRKQGVGRKLVEIAKEWTKERNADYVELNVLTENETAFNLYENTGFKVVSHLMRWRTDSTE